eukprot:TRINITY_DN60754_c0_g1_i1.p1 TRINITY_DN60754_c0_g1~~TRINITY_DN60754_c0_g1_i1.p1  ORF type:complete len:539 (+),score=102.10 TRINITY_DN60754_c0_g1_i1:90-1706(+)
MRRQAAGRGLRGRDLLLGGAALAAVTVILGTGRLIAVLQRFAGGEPQKRQQQRQLEQKKQRELEQKGHREEQERQQVQQPTSPTTRRPAPPSLAPLTDGEIAELLRGCCIGEGCDPLSHFDSWCYSKNSSCPEFKSGWACGWSHCSPRWTAAAPGRTGSLSFREVARCVTALARVTGVTTVALPPLPAADFGSPWTEADFPMSVVHTRHMCWRPCNPAWPCHGKMTKTTFALDPCWRHFYKTGKHHKIRKHKSLMAVWTPPVVDQISTLLSQRGGYDPKLHATIRMALDHPPGTVVDVGANLGVVSMYAAHQGHRVIAFDATPWTRHKLELSAWLNNFSSRVTVVAKAVGAEPGTAHLAVVPGNMGGNQLVRSEDHSLVKDAGEAAGAGRPGRKGTVAVPITTLDAALEREAPFFIKIDVEGHEIQVLQGASRTLRKHKPTLVVETCYWCRPQVLFTFLQEHEYVCGRDDPLVDRTVVAARRGKWPWDVELVLRPEFRHQLRPNVFCIWDPVASRAPFDPNPNAPYDKQWEAYRVDTK